jgi:DNA invertase Pin-like site-specific DNA recombinase
MKKVALYARVSTKDKGQDVENQLLQLRMFAAKEGWEIVHEYVDHVSGGQKDKPEFTKMMLGAYQKQFDVVLFWSLDRFTREGVTATLKYLEELDGHKIAWHSYSERYLTSALGEFKHVVIAVLAAVARQEKIRIQERVRAGLDRAKAGGWKKTEGRAGGRAKAAFDRERAKELHQAGKSLRAIATELNTTAPTLQRYFKSLKAAA